VWALRYLCYFAFHNRGTIVLASLVWLIWRSGSQPRRLSYPCQQAAAANLGIFAIPFIPGVARLRSRHADPRRRAFAVVSGGVCLAGMSAALISGGIAFFSSGNVGQPPQLAAANSGTGVPAVVSIVKDEDGVYTDAELDRMVRRAVALAGGLESVIVDKRGGGDAPWDSPDGHLSVIIIPNMSGLQPGLNTDPRITHTIVDMAWEAGAQSVKLGGAATGDNWTAFMEQGYDTNGDGLLDHDPRVELIDLNDTGTTGACAGLVQYNNVTQITLPTSGPGAAVARTSYWVHNELLKTDAMIVIPCIKNHDLGTVTLGLKMRIGTAPQDIYFAPWLGCSDEPYLRWEMHNVDSVRFPWTVGTKPTSEPECVQRSLVDLNLVRPHDFVVLDALVGCESGPLNYDEPSTRVKSIMASRDSLALDTIGALVMGYDPDRIPCLNMANNTQALGVMDRRLIRVVGDHHVKDVRVDFSLSHPKGYATPYRAESIPPTLGGISLVEGQKVVAQPGSVVSCTGVTDNVGVIKAELTLKPAAPPNLLINGGFEEGATGWSVYHSNWGGQSGQVNFASTVAGRVGNNALHLSIPAGLQDSFAVYQQVPVTPGKAYRIDAMWKGNRYGVNQWYEIMLIDGPWDVFQADTGESVVLNNHMFAYDTNSSPNCPGGNPLTASFDWTWTHTQYDEPVDCWNDRDGVRVATGEYMTVVLKAGSCCGTNQADVWFDEVSLTEVTDPEEILVATVLDPPSNFDIVWDATSVPLGHYQARVSVYDAMMNEASIVRNIEIVPLQTPVIAVQPTALQAKVVLGGECADTSFALTNSGVDVLQYSIETDQPWLSVTPTSGSAADEADTITVMLDCSGLAVGTYQGNIIVSDAGSVPPAINSPVTLPVTLVVKTVRADFDQDGDVDQEDFAHVQACLAGEWMPIPSPDCDVADLDGDGDVGPSDITLFIDCKTNPGVAASPACDPTF